MKRIVCVLALLALASCGGSESAGRASIAGAGGQAGTVSGGSGGTGSAEQPEAAGSSGDSNVTCLGDLDQLSKECEPSFDGTPTQLPPCDSLLPRASSYWISNCDDLISYELGSGVTSRSCSYDASSHALVGVLLGDDVTSYCEGTSYTIQAGNVLSPSCHATATETACGAAGAAN